MPLRDFFSTEGVRRFLSRIRISGETPTRVLRDNRTATRFELKRNFRSAVNADNDVGTFAQSLGQTVKRRKRASLRALRNVGVAIRGQARSVIASGRRGRWVNVSTLDGRTSEVCIRHIGLSWPQPYSAIPNRPPRLPTHHCRSWLRFVGDDESVEDLDERPFIQQFREGGPDLQRSLLGPTKFEAIERGDLPPINSISEFENIATRTLAELGLDS